MERSTPREHGTPVRVDRLLSDLEELAGFGGCAGGGVDRASFSAAYRDAVAWLSDRMRAAGMTVRVDAAGNVIGRLGPAAGPAVLCGSHIDSVPGGGRYDGALGVLAGVEVARCLHEGGAALDRALEVVAFADEEGRYLSLLGVRAMVGDLPADELKVCIERFGAALAADMRASGVDPDAIVQAARPASDVEAYVELHIEQGPVLESRGVDIGIVESVVGIQIGEFRFEGQANHAGTTPLGLRRDAFRAAAATVSETYAALERDFEEEHRLTYGAIEVSPGAHNVVPDSVRLVQEIRATREDAIDAIREMTIETAERIGHELKVRVGFESLSRDAAAPMSEGVMERIAHGCEAVGCSTLRMPSGAGHDAQVMAGFCDAGMIFIPSTGGISHNAAEHSTPAQIECGAAVLYETLRSLLNETSNETE